MVLTMRPLCFGDAWIDDFPALRLQARSVATLVAPHQAGVADNVCSEDRRQSALLTGHGIPPISGSNCRKRAAGRQ